MGFSGANMGMNSHILLKAVMILCGKRPGRTWTRSFLQRCKKMVSQRRSKQLATKRNLSSIAGDVASFIDAVEEHSKSFLMKADNVFNCDETRVCVGSDGEIILEQASKERANAMTPRRSTLASLLPFISANGKVLCTFWIVKGQIPEGDVPTEIVLNVAPDTYHRRGTWPRYYGVSKTGFLNTEIYSACVRKFIEIYRLQYPGQGAWVFADNLGCHQNMELAIEAHKNNVELWMLPANTSHFLQPLDSIPFAVLKNHIRSHSDEVSVEASLAGIPTDLAFWKLAYDAEEAGLSPRVIQKGFRETGIFPWSPDRIVSLTRSNLGNSRPSAPTEEERLVEVATQVCQSLITGGQEKQRSLSTQKARIPKNSLHSPLKRVEAYQAKIAAEEEAQRADEERKTAKEEALKRREELKSQLKCLDATCLKHRRSSTQWHKCLTCERYVCPAHKKSLPAHSSQCGGQSDAI